MTLTVPKRTHVTLTVPKASLGYLSLLGHYILDGDFRQSCNVLSGLMESDPLSPSAWLGNYVKL